MANILLTMVIGRICYPVTTLGFGKRIGIWTSGCKQNCSGCVSPELKDISVGKEISPDYIEKYVSNIKGTVDGITISGGEPFLQSKALAEYVERFIKMGIEDIIVYTGYTYEYLTTQDVHTQYILSNISVLIDGKYIKELDDGVGIRGSSNQRIYIFKYNERHKNLHCCKREIQAIMCNGHITNIGIPTIKR